MQFFIAKCLKKLLLFYVNVTWIKYCIIILVYDLARRWFAWVLAHSWTSKYWWKVTCLAGKSTFPGWLNGTFFSPALMILITWLYMYSNLEYNGTFTTAASTSPWQLSKYFLRSYKILKIISHQVLSKIR